MGELFNRIIIMSINRDNPFSFFEKTYYINLDRRPDRKEEALSEFAKFNIAAERFSGIELTAEESKKITDEGGATWDANVMKHLTKERLDDKTRAQRSCSMSHVKLIEKAKKEGLKSVLVFEDDVVFYEDIDVKTMLANALEELEGRPWDLFLLGCNPRQTCIKEENHLLKLGGFFTTHAVAVNHTCFDAIIDFPWKSSIVIDQHMYCLAAERRVNAYSTRQPLAYQGKSYSDIENGFFWGDGTTKNLLRDAYKEWTAV
jgi:GR25 family glycosyltransferase involved in LPS biosynthesis